MFDLTLGQLKLIKTPIEMTPSVYIALNKCAVFLPIFSILAQ